MQNNRFDDKKIVQWRIPICDINFKNIDEVRDNILYLEDELNLEKQKVVALIYKDNTKNDIGGILEDLNCSLSNIGYLTSVIDLYNTIIDHWDECDKFDITTQEHIEKGLKETVKISIEEPFEEPIEENLEDNLEERIMSKVAKTFEGMFDRCFDERLENYFNKFKTFPDGDYLQDNTLKVYKEYLGKDTSGHDKELEKSPLQEENIKPWSPYFNINDTPNNPTPPYNITN